MTLTQFIKKYNWKKVDFDGAYGPQCVDLVQLYNKEVNKVPLKFLGNAKDIARTYPKKYYKWIKNYWWTIPKVGDIVIWGTRVGPYGHIGIVVGRITINRFDCFDQNWPIGWPAHIQRHSYNGVLGFLRKK